jgi:hypothetical protein
MKTIQKVCLLGLTLPFCGFAASGAAIDQKVSYMPRLYIAGYGGSTTNYANLIATGDLLIPAYLSNENALVVYGRARLDPFTEESWEQATWSGSGGLLYRQIVKDTAVLGAYVLGDYNKAPSGHDYWSVGPGIESLGRNWDFHLNGYIPVGEKTWSTEGWAAQDFHNQNYISFQEGTNNIFDHRLAYYEEVGIGGDAEVGYKLFKLHNVLVKGYLQGYYYGMEHNDDVYGGGAKITVQPTRYITFSINDTYDNYQHNVLMAGIQVRVTDLFDRNAGKPIDENNLTDRLLDPIDRNYATIGKGYTEIVHAPDTVEDLGQQLFSMNGIFFQDGGDLSGSGYIAPNYLDYEEGTYGHPYNTQVDIENRGMQAIFDDINNKYTGDIYMFFAPGNYNTYTTGPVPGRVPGQVEVYDQMFMFGREFYYTTPTAGAQRATLIGSIKLDGDNYLDSMRVHSYSYPAPLPYADTADVTAGPTEVVLISKTGNINFNNVEVKEAGSSGYAVSMYMASNVTFNNSQIYAFFTVNGGSVLADGVNIAYSSNINIESNNTVLVTAQPVGTATNKPATVTTNGINVVKSTLNIGSNNTITTTAVGGNSVYSGGLDANAGVTLANVSLGLGSSLNVLGDGNTFSATGQGGTASSVSSGANAVAYVLNIFLSPSGANLLNVAGNGNTFNASGTGGTVSNSAVGYSNGAKGYAYDIAFENFSVNNTAKITGNGNNFLATAQGGNASTTATGAGGNYTQDASAYAYIFSAIGGTNNIFAMTGSYNTLNAVATGGTSFSPASAQRSQSISSASATDIWVSWFSTTPINIGSHNTLIATANGGSAVTSSGLIASSASSQVSATGIYINLVNVPVYLGDYNTISVTAKGGTARSVSRASSVNATVYGININNSTANINIGSHNNISASGQAGTLLGSTNANSSAAVTAAGILGSNFSPGGGNIYIDGGYNTINVSGVAGAYAGVPENATVYGIYNEKGGTYFANGTGTGFDTITLNAVSGGASIIDYGLRTVSGAFYVGGVLQTSMANLQTLLSGLNISITRTTGGTAPETGNKIQAGANYCPWIGTCTN